MAGWLGGMTMLSLLGLAQADPDCASPGTMRALIIRAMEFELNHAKDANGRALLDALARCDRGPGPRACRAAERRRLDSAMAREGAVIEEKYQKKLAEFEQRCRSVVS
ncbi:MAG TPA: hypothetical protein VFN71_10265 [Methylomirabilota bacterium]|nr:hypothetical protein [Methylomirabilota bacterium]